MSKDQQRLRNEPFYSQDAIQDATTLWMLDVIRGSGVIAIWLFTHEIYVVVRRKNNSFLSFESNQNNISI